MIDRPNVVQLVDTEEYIASNCFQHQLDEAIKSRANVMTITLADILSGQRLERLRHVDCVVSRLKQRTLFNNVKSISTFMGSVPIVVYDQDPWHAFMDDSPYKGAYETISNALNVKTFALTTSWWVDFLRARNLPSTFVRMWVLPRYCSTMPPFENRENNVGFVGSLHPRRKALVDMVEASGIKVGIVQGNALPYKQFMDKMSMIGTFIHNENMEFTVDGQALNINTGLWIKDVEAAARGCFSIRCRGEGSETYLDGIKTVMLYDDVNDVPDLIRKINDMDPWERLSLIGESVDHVKNTDHWQTTADVLIGNIQPVT